MALHLQQTESQQQQSTSFLLDDALFCEEERWEDIVVEEEEEESETNSNNNSNIYYHENKTNTSCCLLPILLLEQDLFWEDEELVSLFSKEEQQQQKQQTHLHDNGSLENDSSLSVARCEAVQWMLKVIAHYGFSPLTSILAINYLDRFLSSLHFQRDKPWMIQLVAVTCLSLAAKVEETHVPLLLDLQVETKYVFEAKTIQRMELMVLSTLQWRMNPVTPISFLDHIIRRLGLKTHLHWEFLKRCERLLLSIVTDSRFVRYLPSVLATATMLHVINQVDPCNSIDYQNQLLGVLKISKEDVDECYELIFEISNTCGDNVQKMGHRKRKFEEIPSSPSGVIDGYFSSDSSNDSWVVVGSSSSSSVSSSPEKHVFKKNRAQEQQMMRLSSSLNNRVFVDAIGSPP